MSNLDKHFTCARCKETFIKDRPDGEAMEESKTLFGDVPKEELVVVCDDCFNYMDSKVPMKGFKG